jgi:hypothetical protein
VHASPTLRPTPPISGNEAFDVLGGCVDHRLRFRRGQAVELARVAVGDQHVDPGRDRAVDDGPQALRRESVVLVERRDQDAGDAGQRLA